MQERNSRNKVLIENLPLSIIETVYKHKEKIVKIGKYAFNSKDDRYLNFIKHGFKCAKCGIEGKYVNLETNYKGNHFNVYAEKDGEKIMLTKDHIYPKSKGGLNNIKNYQVLCEKCNTKKADNSPMRLSIALQNRICYEKISRKSCKTT